MGVNFSPVKKKLNGKKLKKSKFRTRRGECDEFPWEVRPFHSCRLKPLAPSPNHSYSPSLENPFSTITINQNIIYYMVGTLPMEVLLHRWLPHFANVVPGSQQAQSIAFSPVCHWFIISDVHS